VEADQRTAQLLELAVQTVVAVVVGAVTDHHQATAVMVGQELCF
jgi:hypothetical protein